MKKTSVTKSAARSAAKSTVDDLRKEYRLDYLQARPNRFAGRAGSKAVVVLLSDDVARVFKDSESVNAALRAIINVIPSVIPSVIPTRRPTKKRAVR